MAVMNGVASSMLLAAAAGTSGAKLRFGTASRWALIRNEVHRRYGWYPEITSAGDGFRSEARQEELFRRNYTTTNTGHGPVKRWQGSLWWRKTAGTPSAAVPGTSNHGFGTTSDVVNVGTLNQFGTTRYNQFADVATEYGFSNAEGRSIGEPWHWSDTQDPDVITGSTVLPTSPDLEEDMPTAEEIAAAVWNHQVTYQGAGPAPAYVFLADARGFGIKAVDSIGTLPAAVWGHEITHDGAGPAPTAVFLADARAFAIRAVDAIGNLTVKPLDADAVAAALAPLLAANMTGLSDADLTAIKKVVQDEADRRARAGLAQ